MFKTLISSALLILAVAGCSKSESSDITLQLDWKPEPEFGGFYAADLNGSFTRQGLHVTIAQGGAGAPTVELLGAGKVPFAIVSADQIPAARKLGAKVVALFAVYQTSPIAIMSKADRGFTNLGDIFSHPGTLAIQSGLPYTDYLKQKYGFDKLKIVPSPFGDLSVYQSDPNYSMQCYAASEPLAAEKLGVKTTTFLVADSGYNPYSTVLATSDDYLKAHPDVVKKMVAAVGEGWQAYLADPSKTNAAMHTLNPTMTEETFNASAEAQKKLIATDDTKANGIGSMSAVRWDALLQQLRDLKADVGDVKASDCYTTVSAVSAKAAP